MQVSPGESSRERPDWLIARDKNGEVLTTETMFRGIAWGNCVREGASDAAIAHLKATFDSGMLAEPCRSPFIPSPQAPVSPPMATDTRRRFPAEQQRVKTDATLTAAKPTLSAAPGKIISTRTARLRIVRDRCRAAIDARFFAWCGSTPPALSPRSDAHAACEAAFRSAVKGSKRGTGNTLELWKTAKMTCALHNVSFARAMDTPMLAGRTPLQHLIRTREHSALNYVHHQLPRGDYHGRIHLGWAYEREDGRRIETLTSNGFRYRGQADGGELEGYGVLHWPNGTFYVGTWNTYHRGIPDEPGYSPAWLAAGLRDTYLHDLALCYRPEKKIVLAEPPEKYTSD